MIVIQVWFFFFPRFVGPWNQSQAKYTQRGLEEIGQLLAVVLVSPMRCRFRCFMCFLLPFRIFNLSWLSCSLCIRVYWNGFHHWHMEVRHGKTAVWWDLYQFFMEVAYWSGKVQGYLDSALLYPAWKAKHLWISLSRRKAAKKRTFWVKLVYSF